MIPQPFVVKLLYLTLIATVLGATTVQPPKASEPKPFAYKQTNRKQILRRMKMKGRDRRAQPSNLPGVPDVSPSTDDTVTYYYFHLGSGYIENDNNPSNDSEFAPPQETTFGGDQGEAVQACADFSWDQGYFAFQVYYRKSRDQWTCRSYIEAYTDDRSDSSYFNVPDPDVTLAYGYQQKY
ncbi:uncharacterized protein IL334_001393 [Kwoniella shivajii]|uniref:Uncharacterized protein n=1 Tax=Kwoniella shivajii TaxID=564305 RepID=A0ABZ1CUV2_9TREE|nr:hypothetical protein IL334_001393 [Kwoniella shivajii]